jgi:hypothetical protein
MRPPHFRKLSKRAKRSVPPSGPKIGGETGAEHQSGEVVIRADRIFLGSSYPHRLRVVCFESPSDSIASRL